MPEKKWWPKMANARGGPSPSREWFRRGQVARIKKCTGETINAERNID